MKLKHAQVDWGVQEMNDDALEFIFLAFVLSLIVLSGSILVTAIQWLGIITVVYMVVKAYNDKNIV